MNARRLQIPAGLRHQVVCHLEDVSRPIRAHRDVSSLTADLAGVPLRRAPASFSMKDMSHLQP
jgi:hypothetical protein